MVSTTSVVGDRAKVALATDGVDFLVAFEEVRTPYRRVYLGRVSGAGAAIGNEFLIVDNVASTAFRVGVRVGADASAFVVTWTEGVTATPGMERVFYARVSPTGQVVRSMVRPAARSQRPRRLTSS